MAREIMHHLRCAAQDVGRYVILPGDPGRVEKIAARLDGARYVACNREYNLWTGTLEGEPVSVCSTGIGGPGAAIAMEELAKCGADTFVRVGTCGGIDESVKPGTLIIATAAIRRDGTGLAYLPVEFPAVADFSLTSALRQAAEKLRLPYRMGVVECKDSFYGQHSPETMPVCDELKSKWKAWKMAGAIGSEMESSTLFIVASVRRLRAASILLLCRNREREAALGRCETNFDTTGAITVAVEAIRTAILEDRE